MFLNDNVNDVVSKKLDLNSQIFSDRNEFDHYVLATDAQRDQAVRLGLNKKTTISLGSVRYSRKWHDVLFKIENRLPRENISSKVHICFMTPHWSYNVDKNDILRMIEKIGLIKDVILYVKPHTRGTGYIDSAVTDKYQSNIKYVTNETSFEVISKTDITIAFGTSIILETILQNKYIVHPNFFHTNKTIFDNEGSFYHAKNIEEVLESINFIITNKPEKNQNAYNDIIKKFVYNNQDDEPIDNYTKLITKNSK